MPEATTERRPGAADVELDERGLEGRLQGHRSELVAHCYRMLGSSFEAEDAVQEAMVRAWRAYDRFEGRSTLRSWLYRIATNVCFDQLNGRQRRAMPMDLGAAGDSRSPLGEPLPEVTWIDPLPGNSAAARQEADPAEAAVSKESVRLAFVTALQRLPARQRAVLVLREVLRWKAEEVAQLLETSVASVNSALQRARATLKAEDMDGSEQLDGDNDDHRELLANYVEAFESFDVDRLVSLLRDDAVFCMPPFALWLRGHDDVRYFYQSDGAGCEGSRMVPVVANGSPAVAQYKPGDTEGVLVPWAVHVLEIADGQIASISHFIDLDGRLFPHFGLPTTMEAAA